MKEKTLEDSAKELDSTITLALYKLVKVADASDIVALKDYALELMLLHEASKKIKTTILISIMYSLITILACDPDKVNALRRYMIKLLVWGDDR